MAPRFAGEGRNAARGKLPEFGAIFMSNKATRKECFERELLGLPSGQAPFVNRVKAGMLLFLFEFERRELHGVFQATCDGAMNIVPNAYSSSGKQFPAQVKFTKIWRCAPLAENEFRDAIRENYFAPKKFNFGLSERQVTRLLKLFSSKKLKVEPHSRQQVHSEAARRVEYPIHKDKDALSHRRMVFPNGEKEERNENGSFKPANANVWLKKFFGNGIDSEGFLLQGEKDEQNEHRSLEWRNHGEEFVDHLGYQERDNCREQLPGATMGKERELRNFREVGRLADYEQPVIREHSPDIDPRAVRRNDLVYSVSANRRRFHDAAFSETYRLTDENDHGGGPFSSIPLNFQDFQHGPDIYFPKPFVGVYSSTNNQLQQPSIMPHRQNHDCQRSDYGDPMGRGSFSHSPPGAQTIAGSTCHYDTDVSSLNYNGSLSLGDLDLPRLNYKYIPSPPHNSSAAEGSSPCHWSIPLSGNVPSPRYRAATSYNESSYVASTTANSAMLTRKAYENEDSLGFSFPKPSFASAASAAPEHYGKTLIKEGFSCPFSPNKSPHSSFDHRCAVTSHDKLGHRLLPSEGSEASAGYVPASSDCQTRTTIGHREKLPPDLEIYPPPQTSRSDRQHKRASVFSRLALPAEATKVDDSTGNESSIDLSVSDILTMLHQSSAAWTKDKCLKPVAKICGLVSNTKTKKKMTSNMNGSKDQVTDTSGINSSPSCQETDVQTVSNSITEKKMTHKTKVSKEQVTDTSGVISSTAYQETEVQIAGEIPFVDFKRRKMVKKSEDNPTENCQNTFSGGQQKRRRLIRPIFSQKDVFDDNMFGNNETGSKESQQHKMPEHVGQECQEEKPVDAASCLKSEADAIMETPHDKMPESADLEEMHVDMACCLKSEADAIKETMHDKMPECADQEEMHVDVDVVSCSKFGADQTMKTVAFPSVEGCDGKEESSTNVCISGMPLSELVVTDESQPLQNADPESTRFQIDLVDRDVDGKSCLSYEIKMDVEAGFSSVVASNHENQIEASMYANVQDGPSQQSVKDKTLNVVKGVLLFENSKGELSLLDERDQFLQEQVLEVHRGPSTEQMETGFSLTVINEYVNEQEASKNHAVASQHVVVQDMPSQLSDKEKALNAAESLLFKNPKGRHLVQDGHGIYYQHADDQDMPSQQSDKEGTLNAEEGFLFKNHTGVHMSQDGHGNYYQFLQEPDPEMHREQTEAWTISGVSDRVNSKPLYNSVTSSISGEIGSISSLVDHSWVGDISDELGKGKEEDDGLLLSLGSLTRHYNQCFQALGQGNPQEFRPKEV